jgi:Protein of unknown function (DUF2695)
MPRKEEKQRRKAILARMAQKGRAEAEARLPLSKEELKALFDHVDNRLEDQGCDHTLAHTLEFLAQRRLPHDAVVPWLKEYGGYCDCEVIANVEEVWGEVVGSV